MVTLLQVRYLLQCTYIPTSLQQTINYNPKHTHTHTHKHTMAIEQKRYKICGGICVCIFTQCLYILLLFLLLLYDIYDYFTGDRKNQKLFTIIIYCELCFVLCCVEANRTVLFLYYIMFLFDSFIFRFYSPGTLFIV